MEIVLDNQATVPAMFVTVYCSSSLDAMWAGQEVYRFSGLKHAILKTTGSYFRSVPPS